MTEIDCFLIAIGIVIGYCLCFVVEIYRHLRDWHRPPQLPEPTNRREKDAAGNYTTEIDKERCLIKAGALIIAEQDRLDRALQKVITKLAEVQTQNKTNE